MPEDIWRSIYAVCLRYDRGTWFARRFGVIAVRPLGVLPTELDEWLGMDPGCAVPSEPVGSARYRLAQRNRAVPPALRPTDFTVLGFRLGSDMQVTVGRGGGRSGLERMDRARLLAASHGRVFEELDAATQEALLRVCEDWEQDYRVAERRLWPATAGEILGGDARGTREHAGILGFMVDGKGVLHVLEREDDAELADLVRRYEEAELALRERLLWHLR